MLDLVRDIEPNAGLDVYSHLITFYFTLTAHLN